jgi:GntR family transcriptional regulator/MocR family aminotransferase
MVVEVFAASGPHRLVHVTPSHQDPTGATLSLTRRLQLLDVAGRTGCLVVEDDYDSEFRYEGRPVESLQGLDRNGLVVYAGTFSKSVLPGLRIGFLVLPRPLIEPLTAAKSLWDSGAPVLEQAALAEFIRCGDYERHIRRMRRLYRSRRDALLEALSERFGERVVVGERQGGLNVLVTLDLDVTDVELARRAATRGIGLRPASPYWVHPPGHPTFLMGFGGLPEDVIRAGIRELAAVVEGE